MVGVKLVGYSYLQNGMWGGFAGMLVYFWVMSDYGFKPTTLFFYALPGNWKIIDWFSNIDGKIDLRYYFR